MTVGCHSGVAVGGQMYQKFGITQGYWKLTGSTEKELFKDSVLSARPCKAWFSH